MVCVNCSGWGVFQQSAVHLCFTAVLDGGVFEQSARTIESSLHEIIGRRPGVPPRHASPHRPRSQRRQNIRGVSTFLQQSKMWAKLKENEELMGNCWSKQRKRTNLSENEEMVRKICRVLCVDVNLSSRLLHCCPFTLCVYIGDFPQIHCGYNKNFYVPGQELFLFLVTSFALSNWTISYFPLKVTEKNGGSWDQLLGPFCGCVICNHPFLKKLKEVTDVPPVEISLPCPLCKSTRFTNSIVPKMSIVGSLLIGGNPSRCTAYM